MKVFDDFSWKVFMFSKEVSLENYLIQALSRILTVDSVSVFFQEINKSIFVQGMMTLETSYYT